MTEIQQRLRRTGVIAVLRAPSAEAAVRAANALIAGGVTGIEITYSTPDAPRAIREIVEAHGEDAFVGAGTLTRPEQAEESARAGAAFLVSPGTRPELTRAMRETGAGVMTGALTPSEVMEALELGVDAVKLFPASLTGPSYLKSLRGPFGEAPFLPTGGVDAQNLPDWFAAGAIAVGAGSELCSAAAMRDEDWTGIQERAAEFAGALQRVGGAR